MNQKAVTSFFIDTVAKVRALRIHLDWRHMDKNFKIFG